VPITDNLILRDRLSGAQYIFQNFERHLVIHLRRMLALMLIGYYLTTGDRNPHLSSVGLDQKNDYGVQSKKLFCGAKNSVRTRIEKNYVLNKSLKEESGRDRFSHEKTNRFLESRKEVAERGMFPSGTPACAIGCWLPACAGGQ
jgi:hypothetical protein